MGTSSPRGSSTHKDSRASHDRDASRHRSYVGQVERAKRNLTLHNIPKIAEILEIDPGRLLRGLPAAQE
jgi:transcriptional regulator with XRE-family HTH domain